MGWCSNRHLQRGMLLTVLGFGPLEVRADLAPQGVIDKPETLVLATNIGSSFSGIEGHDPDVHQVMRQVACILDSLKVDYQIQSMPWRRAYQEVKNNRVQGFFTSIPMRELEPYTQLSAPLQLESWNWFWRRDGLEPSAWHQGFRIGSILGSQQEGWLHSAGYQIALSANSLPQLIKLLKSGRIDGFIADKEYFARALAELGLDSAQFSSRFYRYMPLGVSFNQALLVAHPQFLDQFNRAIKPCTPTSFALSAHEQSELRQLLAPTLQRLMQLPGLERALRQRNSTSRMLSSQTIAALDTGWVRAYENNDPQSIQYLVDPTLSAQLRAIQGENDLLTEIIITDNRGLNLAVSEITSDYWQGDEDKFTQAFGRASGSIYFGEVEYDESSRHFQVQLSLPINREKTRIGEGVLVVGIDIERALAQMR